MSSLGVWCHFSKQKIFGLFIFSPYIMYYCPLCEGVCSKGYARFSPLIIMFFFNLIKAHKIIIKHTQTGWQTDKLNARNKTLNVNLKKQQHKNNFLCFFQGTFSVFKPILKDIKWKSKETKIIPSKWKGNTIKSMSNMHTTFKYIYIKIYKYVCI